MGGTLWSREKVAERILNGDTLLVYRGTILSIPNSWLEAHPGGALAILHFVGRDATDEVDAFHDEQALRKLRAFAVGSVELGEEGWQPLVPPVMSGWVRRIGLDGKQTWYNEATAVRSTQNTEISPSSQILLVEKQATSTSLEDAPSLASLAPPPSDLSLRTQQKHSAAYKELHEKITAAGLYKTPYLTGYGPEVVRYALFAGISILAYSYGWFMTSALFLGALWHQLVFTVHDLGHMGVTHSWVKDRLIAITLADFIGGLSIGWWANVSTRSFVSYSYLSVLHRITTYITVSYTSLNRDCESDLFLAVVTNHPSQ
jgi:delta8-fatty-acid desaturase